MSCELAMQWKRLLTKIKLLHHLNLETNRITTHEWVWEMTKIKEHSGADPIIMSIMSGKRSFQGDKTDICNSYFYEIFIIEMIISVIIILSVIIIFKDINCKDRNYI